LVNWSQTSNRFATKRVSRYPAGNQIRAGIACQSVHTGDRAQQFRYQPKESIKSYEYLSHMEGSTERSEAFRKLSRMLSEIEQNK